MKRRLWLTALALCAMTLFSACAVLTSPKTDGSVSAAYANILTGPSYYLKFTADALVNGEIKRVEYEYARRGDDAAQRGGVSPRQLGMVKDSAAYLVDYDARTVTEYQQPMTPGYSAAFNFKGLAYTGYGSATDGKTSYSYDEYTTDAGQNVRFCFDKGKLVGMQFLSGGAVAKAIAIETLSAQIPDYMFAIPSDFSQMEGD